ncbi:MAG: 50S ribosomal protein L22 [Solirubrobacterales bacterium]
MIDDTTDETPEDETAPQGAEPDASATSTASQAGDEAIDVEEAEKVDAPDESDGEEDDGGEADGADDNVDDGDSDDDDADEAGDAEESEDADDSEDEDAADDGDEADTEDEADDGDKEAKAKAKAKEASKPRRRSRASGEGAKRTPRRRDQHDLPVVRAKARFVRSSPRKARLVADQIRGRGVEDAKAMLTFSPKGVAEAFGKLLDSAVANAESDHDLIADELKIGEIAVDEGPTIKRYRPRARGRATPIHKRTSHLSIGLIPDEDE